MTDTPRMSRKGSYKGVVGGSKQDVRTGGGVGGVDVDEEEEVLGEVEDDGEEEETGLGRRDEEDDVDEAEDEDDEVEEAPMQNRDQRVRRPV